MELITKLTYLITFIVGILIGLGIAYFLVINGIETIGSSFQIQNLNVTLQINETAIIEAQKAMRGMT